MTPDEALAELRNELQTAGVPTEDRDVFWCAADEPMLSLAPGLVIWIGRQHGFRWPDQKGRWRKCSLDDVCGVVDLILPIYKQRMSGVEAATQAEPV
ncbi:hypothetical protein AB0B45_15465 [Nonomuraea sp. NPDC049152]|uniref:hypothetical protein n=1 Tax=Nonomuraea sp. NPDC049152 TaxID=3154350 RepID=UPI0033DCD555